MNNITTQFTCPSSSTRQTLRGESSALLCDTTILPPLVGGTSGHATTHACHGLAADNKRTVQLEIKNQLFVTTETTNIYIAKTGANLCCQ